MAENCPFSKVKEDTHNDLNISTGRPDDREEDRTCGLSQKNLDFRIYNKIMIRRFSSDNTT